MPENRDNMDYRSLGFLSVSHMVNDISQGAIPALLPFLVLEHGLSYLAVSGVVLAATVISSLIQPFLGFYSDRRPAPWLMPVGMLTGGLGIAFTGIAPNYWMIMMSVLISGVGVAAFHPEGSRYANYVSGQRATGMSFFTVGGTLGFALGPVLLTPLVINLGLPGTLFMALPSAIMLIPLLLELPRLTRFRSPASRRQSDSESDKSMWGAFSKLTGVIVLRTTLYFGLMSFVPLYYLRIRGVSVAEANSALTVMLLSGAAGSLLGGFMADRLGLKRVLVGSLLVTIPLLLSFISTTGPFSLLMLGLTGTTTIGSASIAVLMGQSYLKSHIGIASGITIGSAIGMGGLGVPILGAIADSFGLVTTMYSMVAMPVLAAILAITLPELNQGIQSSTTRK